MHLIFHVQIFETEMWALIPQNSRPVLRLEEAFEVGEKAINCSAIRIYEKNLRDFNGCPETNSYST